MQDLSLKSLAVDAAMHKGTDMSRKKKEAGQALSSIIFGVTEERGAESVPELFLNISLKRFYAVMFKGCLMASRGRNPERAARYKKIYSMITLSVPGAERMTIGQFLRYINEECMNRECPEGIDKKQYIQDISKGKHLAKLFFVDTFEPILNKYKLNCESVVSKLCS